MKAGLPVASVLTLCPRTFYGRPYLLNIRIDPSVSFIQQQTEQRNIGAAEASGFFPGVAISEEADDGNRMSDAAAGFLSPYADDEESATQFMYGACFFHWAIHNWN